MVKSLKKASLKFTQKNKQVGGEGERNLIFETFCLLSKLGHTYVTANVNGYT
jgi:hypothetical protein